MTVMGVKKCHSEDLDNVSLITVGWGGDRAMVPVDGLVGWECVAFTVHPTPGWVGREGRPALGELTVLWLRHGCFLRSKAAW